jgi:hypothetical protein
MFSSRAAGTARAAAAHLRHPTIEREAAAGWSKK